MHVQDLIYLTAALLAGYTAIRRLTHTYKAQKWDKQHRIILKIWLFAAFVAITALISTVTIYEAISRISRISNLAWLLAYLLVTLLLYTMANVNYLALRGTPEPLWMRRGLLVTFFLLIGIFVLGISSQPSSADHTYPQSWLEVIFMLVAYGYSTLICLALCRFLYQIGRTDTVLHTGLRWFVVSFSLLLAALFFCTRFIFVLFAFVLPLNLAQFLINLSQPLFFGTILLWPLFYMPLSIYKFIARPILFVDKLRALHDLQSLQRLLANSCNPSQTNQSRWSTWRNIDFYIYRHIIELLDCTLLLKAQLSKTEPEPAATAVSNSSMVSSWHRDLALIDAHLEYPSLVTQYRQIGQEVRKGGKT